jgi:hypothetical protein
MHIICPKDNNENEVLNQSPGILGLFSFVKRKNIEAKAGGMLTPNSFVPIKPHRCEFECVNIMKYHHGISSSFAKRDLAMMIIFLYSNK